MPISAGTTVETFSGTASTTHTANLPTYSAGDVVQLVVAGNPDGTGTRGTLSLPSGWSWTHTSAETGAASTGELAGIHKVMAGSEGTTLGLSYDNSVMVQAVATPLTGVDNTTPIDATAPATTVSSGSNGSSPAITTVTDGAWVGRSILTDGAANVTVIPSGHTQLGTFRANNPPSNGQNTAVAYEVQATAGDAGTAQWLHGSEEYVAATWAWRPSQGIDTVTPSEFDMDNSDVDIASSSGQFDASGNTVYISDADTLAGSVNEVDISSAVNTESTTLINLDLTLLSGTELGNLQTLGPGTRYIIVETASDEYPKQITLHRPQAFVMAASANIAASGEATTAQLTAPAGKTTGDFVAGRIQDDENPADAVDITADDYTELEDSIKGKALSREVAYLFRKTKAGDPLDTYTVTPQLTISSATNYTMDAAAGSYTWTGTAANLEYHAVIVAESVAYAWAGTAANLELHTVLATEAGSYTWAGQTASLEFGALLDAEVGSYTWTGTAASLELDSILSAEAGSYNWTGQDASLLLSFVLDSEAGSYAWTGQDATLTYLQALTLDAEAGSYLWTGTAASLILDAILTAESASYVWTGQTATLLQGFNLVAASGSYSWTGQTATLVFDAMLSAESGTYAWTGQDATLTYLQGATLVADAGAYLWSGQEATFLYDRIMEADSASYLWTGQAATLHPTGIAAVTGGAFYAEPDRRLQKRVRDLELERDLVKEQVTDHIRAKEHAKPKTERKVPRFTVKAARNLAKERHDTALLVAELDKLNAEIKKTAGRLATVRQEEDDMEVLLLLQ